MNKFILISIAAGSLALLSVPASAQAVRIGTEGAYAPWNFLDDSGNVAGYEIDLAADLCARAALECTFVVNEWDTIIPNLQAGNYDIIMAGMSITNERKEQIDFSAPYFPPDPSRYAMAADATFDFAALTGARIGVQGNTIQAAFAEETFGANNTIVAFETGDQSIADLAAGNVDLVLADGNYLLPIIEGSAGTLKIEGPEVMIGGGVGIGLRQADDELETKLNEALAAAKADGTVDRLIAKWFDGIGPFFAE